MSDNPTPSWRPTVVEMEGSGPFALPPARALRAATSGDVTVVEFALSDGRVFLIPTDEKGLRDLHRLTEMAIAALPSSTKGPLQ